MRNNIAIGTVRGNN